MKVSIDSQARGVYTQCSETILDVNKVSENMSHISVILAWKVAIIFFYSTANGLFPLNMKSSLYKSLALEIFVKKWNNLKKNKFVRELIVKRNMSIRKSAKHGHYIARVLNKNAV